MIALLVFLPLAGALLVGLSVRVIPVRLANLVTCGAMVVSAVLAGFVFSEFASLSMYAPERWHEMSGGQGLVYRIVLLPWIDSGNFSAAWSLRVDALTAIMLIVVTWVSAVVHIYSVGYMSHDEHRQRFMAYLSLFTFAMLMLVTADNLIQLFFGWEGVGLCSYLLIGFWFRKPEPNAAAIKAFLMNRIGDIGFALGIFTCFALFNTVSFDAMFAAAPKAAQADFIFAGRQVHALTLACILLFIGAMGKSAQLGLHTWLPDAMEGPTPVSALIHAATMVTAGVFMVARCSPLFELAPAALAFVTVIGALTAFYAATVGMVQNDIKRVIAYSTCSQLGYMFFACGVGAYAAAIFHLATHAFFKALLFLGAGSVIHGLSGEQDMRRMGGIWRHMKITYIYMWIGSLALAGIPFFAGYYSKDMILEASFAADGIGKFAFWMGILAAFMTAFYSWRLIFLTFHGTPRADEETMRHVHESPPVMLAPLLLLAAGSVAAGYIGYHWLSLVSGDATFWQASLASHNAIEEAHGVPAWVSTLPLLVALSGIALAGVAYLILPSLPGRIAAAAPALYRFFLRKWYFDELYDVFVTQKLKRLGLHLWKFWDVRVIDDLGPNGAASLARAAGERVAHAQTGYVYHYAFAMLLGLLGLFSWVVMHA
ncbi:MAG: NADH-quinone oxidoreductase subunit L [Alphaproteobacteria bacterium]|nr:NADH-quinone oxidoreductase subunit L [Alphaproteobacteria bacterium]